MKVVVRQTSRVNAPHIWGIGLTRTGTKSLSRALCTLGYAAVHWPTTRQLLYEPLEAATDESVAAVYRVLDERYPGSLFVLTERNVDDWIESTRRQRSRFEDVYGRRLWRLAAQSEQWRDRAVEVQFTQMMLYGTMRFDEASYREGFRRHYDEVLRYFANRPHALLRLNICAGDGWQPLCQFLGDSAPDVPFPHANVSRTR